MMLKYGGISFVVKTNALKNSNNSCRREQKKGKHHIKPFSCQITYPPASFFPSPFEERWNILQCFKYSDKITEEAYFQKSIKS